MHFFFFCYFEIEKYDLENDHWETLKSEFNTGRQDFGAAAFLGKIYVCGGINDLGERLSSVEVYDPARDRYLFL